MDKIEQNLKSLVLQNVEFTLDGKILKRGKIRLFNTKQFFIRFKLESDGDIKDWELPYPYFLEPVENGFMFNYCVSSFCPPTELTFYKMKLANKGTSSRLHDSQVRVMVVDPAGA